MHHKSDERKELIDICRSNYKGNYEEMEIIDDFEKNYDAEDTIWWYTRESCFYRILNKALRVQDFDMLFSLRFFITDIADMINKRYQTFIRTCEDRSIISVYRGQVIENDELELMKKNIKEYLSMNSFLSTSRKRPTAHFYARHAAENNRDLLPIIFEIEINPRLRTKAFADVTQLSFFKSEDEVLIMLGALFRIEEVIYDSDDQMWIARLSLASEDDFNLKEIFSHIKGKIGHNTSLDSLGKLLIRMGENEKALKCYERMLKESLLAVGDARLGLGWTHLRCNKTDESRAHFGEALVIRQHVLGENHPSIGETYSFLGELHLENKDYNEALVDLKKAIKIQEKTLPPDSLDLAATYDSTANTYTIMEKYDLALEYYKKVLKIREKKLPTSHPQIASIYKNLGWMYESKKSYSEALYYYQKSLEISRKTLPPTHCQIVETENAICQLNTK
jgi:tetratricopeptide (TPR) repeat protein